MSLLLSFNSILLGLNDGNEAVGTFYECGFGVGVNMEDFCWDFGWGFWSHEN